MKTIQYDFARIMRPNESASTQLNSDADIFHKAGILLAARQRIQ